MSRLSRDQATKLLASDPSPLTILPGNGVPSNQLTAAATAAAARGAGAGPAPVFRQPSSESGPAASLESVKVNSATETGVAPGEGQPRLPTQSGPIANDQGNKSSSKLSLAVNKGVIISSEDNSLNINKADDIITKGSDPNAPFIVYEDDISSNLLGNDKKNSGQVNIDPRSPKTSSRYDKNRLNPGNVIINDNYVNLDTTEKLESSENQNSIDGKSGATSPGKTTTGNVGSGLANQIPPNQRLLKPDSGQSLLDFEPGGSSLYVSVQRPLQVSSAPACTFPSDFGQDQFELSTSEFGYPKSIVQQAMKDSVAEAVLKILTDIMYEGVMATQVPGYPRNRGLNNLYLINGDLRQGQGAFDSKNFIDAVEDASDERLPLSSFEPLDSTFGKSNFGTSFGFNSAPNAEEKSVGRRRGDTTIGKNDIKTNDYRRNNRNGEGVSSKSNKSNLQEQYKGSQESKSPSEQQTGTRNASKSEAAPGLRSNFDNSNPRNEATSAFNRRASDLDLPDTRFSSFEPFRSSNPFLQTSGIGGGLLRGGKRGSGGGSSLDRLFPPKVSEMFLDTPPSPVAGEAGDAPFISYNNGQRSQAVDGPFNFDSKSLFGSLPSSPFGSSLSGNSGQGPAFGSSLTGSNPQGSSFRSALSSGSSDNQSGIPNFGPSNFGTSGPLFPDSNDSKTNTGTDQGIQGFPKSQFNFPRNFRRKKRQASLTPDKTRVTPTCSPTYKLLRQYKNYNGACFVVIPESQGVYFAECSNSPCSRCRFEGGASRCTAERVPIWVWSYCEAGPNKGKVMPDRVQVSVTCSCKTTQCQSALNGR
ncbi:hypothetical protein PoB_003558100 [Plakobranchus ocellatus]|uniref:Bursicon n=1 Tax=Plakobranchus ocellatus TaxID=259542 RepID=A0AAV4AR92_9GAST|nr:hypothetical protein PoB_003558100 [Plakobranchus ocellatus]